MTAEKTSFPPSGPPTASFPYRVEAKVGVGSMGVVYRAIEVELDRPVAIKALRRSLLEDETAEAQEEIRRRFKQEARAAAALSHPAVTTVHRVGEVDGVPFIAMEWLEGMTLEALLAERPRLEAPVAVRFILELLSALEVAHRQGVVHRDIKPANLMILKADGRLKVTDFGIAMLRGRELVNTRDGQVLATPKFASPEQLTGTDVDGRSDLFACGILLYVMLGGAHPFRGSNFMELANAIILLEPVALRECNPRIPEVLEAVVRRALMKDREDRFQTAEAMSEPLRAWLREIDGRSEYAQLDEDKGEQTPGWHMPVRSGLPHHPALAVVRVVESWPARVLPRRGTDGLIDRLLERPLHAPAFAGAAVLGPICFLLGDGILLGAIDTTTGERGDAVAARRPQAVAARLYPVPTMLPGRVIELLASVLQPPKVRMGDLDSSFINLPALAAKLQGEHFDGVMRLHHEQDLGLVLFDRGNAVLGMYSSGWEEVRVAASWQRWIGSIGVVASIEEKVIRPLTLWYRRVLRDLRFDVVAVAAAESSGDEPQGASSSRLRQQTHSSTRKLSTWRAVRLVRSDPDEPMTGGKDSRYQQAPAYRLLLFVLNELPARLAECGRMGAWKYLSDWLRRVERANLHHALRRPDTQARDFFDVVTEDRNGKVLHVMDRVSEATPAAIDRFLAKVVEAKSARNRSGDIGAAILAAPSFDVNCIATYHKRIAERSASFFNREEQLTGYAGFMRISARRGFHLLLVETSEEGFEPILL